MEGRPQESATNRERVLNRRADPPGEGRRVPGDAQLLERRKQIEIHLFADQPVFLEDNTLSIGYSMRRSVAGNPRHVPRCVP